MTPYKTGETARAGDLIQRWHGLHFDVVIDTDERGYIRCHEGANHVNPAGAVLIRRKITD